jgi:hypothetical protein
MNGPLAAGVAALRRFYRPFLLIQATAVLVVVAYHKSARVQTVCAALAAVKTAGGLPFAAASASFAGGILPELAKRLADWRHNRVRDRGGKSGAGIVFNIAFFAFNGIVIDVLYRGEARLFGTGASIATVASKTAFDQFVFNPLWLPLIIALYTWQRQGFHLGATIRALRVPHFYRTRVLPLLLPAWCFWIPMVSIIYALPVPLQFLLFVLALGAWSLIMVSIASGEAATPKQSP